MSFEAVCNALHVNLRLALKLDLPQDRETVLQLFERLRKECPTLKRLRRFKKELVLESDPIGLPEDGDDADGRSGRMGGDYGGGGEDAAAIGQQWVALRAKDIRAGVLNPRDPEEAYRLHRAVLEIAPYYLSLSPIDLDYVELMYAFDLMSGGNHDLIVHDALFAGSPMAQALDLRAAHVVDCQPHLVAAITPDRSMTAQIEVKTRLHAPMPGMPRQAADESAPITVFLCLRHHGGMKEVAELPLRLAELAKVGEELIPSRLVPHIINPIRQAIATAGH